MKDRMALKLSIAQSIAAKFTKKSAKKSHRSEELLMVIVVVVVSIFNSPSGQVQLGERLQYPPSLFKHSAPTVQDQWAASTPLSSA